MTDISRVYANIEIDTNEIVGQVVRDLGVPDSIDAAHRLASELYPAVTERRQMVYARQVEIMRSQMPDIEIAPPRQYSERSLQKVIRKSTGLSPNPQPALIEFYDPSLIRMAKSRIVPAHSPDNPDVIDEVVRRLTSETTRHIRQSSRDAVWDTARFSHGQGLYARQLSGLENCAFCAMLASRGAVYVSKRAAGGEGNYYHPHCDCRPVLVRRGQKSWEGADQAAELNQLWLEHGNLRDFSRAFRELQEG